MPVEKDVYIFGYQSILAKDSLRSTIGHATRESHVVPARLRGYQRCWNAVRDFETHASKRYVLAPDWAVAPRVAFCNLQAQAGVDVNGICQYVRADQLAGLDFREQGYRRVDVTAQVQAYAGHALRPGVACYTYMDLHPAVEPAPTSLRYFEMGRHGAQGLEAIAPGFFDDYCRSTAAPSALLGELAFVFFSPDGCHLWLLDEQDSSLTLLLRFAKSQLPPNATVSGAPSAELSQSGACHLQWLDLRSRTRMAPQHPWIGPELAIGLICTLEENPQALLSSPFWLHRLAASQSPQLTDAALAPLREDPDSWVRRAVQQRTGELI
jgi:hypothetical protein